MDPKTTEKGNPDLNAVKRDGFLMALKKEKKLLSGDHPFNSFDSFSLIKCKRLKWMVPYVVISGPAWPSMAQHANREYEI